MVFSIDKNLNKIIATIEDGGRTEKYESIISACDNPVCTCENIYLELIPIQFDGDRRSDLRNRKVEIDIDKRTLGYKDKKKISKEELKFSRLFLSKMNENDYHLLYLKHFAYKNKITKMLMHRRQSGYNANRRTMKYWKRTMLCCPKLQKKAMLYAFPPGQPVFLLW